MLNGSQDHKMQYLCGLKAMKTYDEDNHKTFIPNIKFNETNYNNKIFKQNKTTNKHIFSNSLCKIFNTQKLKLNENINKCIYNF